MMEQAAWLAEGWREFGQREIAGVSDNPRIMALYRDAGATGIRHDETAWCAAFVGACLARAGIEGTASLMARSYLAMGEPCTEIRPGAIAVLRRGEDASLGHVGFVVGETETHLVLLGGNQSDAVSVAAFPRGDVLGLRWPAADASGSPRSPSVPASSTEGAQGDEVFAAALAHVLAMEGGFDDDPADPGGPTNLGLTLADLAAWRHVMLDATTRPALLAALRALDAEAVRPIHFARYWRASRADALPPALAVMHFDCAVNQGVGRANRFLQQAVGTSVDGEVGPLSLAAAARVAPGPALAAYAERRRAHYRSLPTFVRFGRGWLNRVDKTLARAADFIGGPSAAPTVAPKPLNPGESSMTTPATSQVPAATTPVPPAIVAPEPSGGKWWGQSMTVWGTLITAAATVAPALGPLFGIDISSDTVRQVGGQAAETVRAVAGLAGTLMAIFGRVRASTPLVRRDVSLRL